MSSSPKYCAARLRAEQERRLREARRRQAALEQQRRAAEEERRRRERLERARQAGQQAVAAVLSRLRTLAESEAGRFVARELEEIGESLQRLEGAARNARDEAALRHIGKDLRRLEARVGQVGAEGEAARLAVGLAREEAALEGLKRRLAALDPARCEKFDASGLRELRELLGRAEALLQREAVAEAGEAITRAAARYERHEAEVQARWEQWSEEKERCEEAVGEAAVRLAGLGAHAVVMRWAAEEVKTLQGRMDALRALLDSEQFSAAWDEAAAVLQGAEEAVARAQEEQLKEDRRQYIVGGIVEVMNRMGFVVQAGSPSLEYPGDPASASIIQAQRLGGGAIAVSVPREGEIWYDVDGFPMRVETASDGREVRSCDEAQEQIEQMHLAMEEAFGIEMGELMWEGRDPDRIRKAADRLPDAARMDRARGAE